ncbi:hypothetical protein GCM10022251_71250 [Phytohabitans flavus]|uniref:Uncharacterized protein n=1 Tax=Phytohabitans flavus TaxID=1076124 RepID=A0A6F8XUI8_9ACTN|nr:hypothetical protein Pflav_038690 [Phytohabitans flavus]
MYPPQCGVGTAEADQVGRLAGVVRRHHPEEIHGYAVHAISTHAGRHWITRLDTVIQCEYKTIRL